MDILNCEFDTAKFLIFSDNVFGTLVYYSHFFALILSLSIGIFVFIKNKKSLTSQLLFLITVLFSLWVFFDLILWATEKQHYTMFFWSLMIIIEPLIYALCVYFVDVFISEKDISYLKKIFLIIPLLPVIILLPTKLTLIGYDFTNCDRAVVEGFFANYYIYAIEIFYILWMFFHSVRIYLKTVDHDIKGKLFLITTGTTLFLASFAFGNIIQSFSDSWTLGQVGLFGMPIFVGFLAFLITKYKVFSMKVLSSEFLIFGLSVLVISITFIRNIENVRIVAIFSFLFVVALGYVLIRSVKREVEQRERLQDLTNQLEYSNDELGKANEKLKGLDKLKTEFLSLASHQLRSPLTAIKGYASMVKDGDFGEIAPKAKEAVERIFESSQNLTMIVEDLLNVSKIESGGMKYEKVDFNMSEIVKTTAEDLSIMAAKKNIKLGYSEDVGNHNVNGDKEKLRQVVMNFIDNAIKYTKEGTIDVKLENREGKVLVSIKDTGMGVSPEIMATLFQKFARGEGQKMNTGGSGLGLYLAKEIVDAHKGRVWVESPGMGLGSTFFIELDVIKN